MAILEMTADDWRSALELSPGDEPDAVIVEGSWWRAQRTEWRLGLLDDVRELAFPDMFIGSRKGRRIAYCCAYGAARTVEPIHIFAQLGARIAVQIGTCGGLQPSLSPGDIVVPGTVVARDGASHLYGTIDCIETDASLSGRAAALLSDRSIPTRRGPHLTWPSLFAQSDALCEQWRQAGYLSVDMETATTASVARHFGVPAVSMLVVWDELSRGRSFLDPLEDDELKALDAGNASVFDVALELAGEV